jgi:hypothetical protein
VLLGRGDATFPAALRVPVGRNPEGLDAGDFNRDGRVDLLVANAGSDSVSVLLGNGDGTVQPPQSFPAGSVPVFAAAADFNRDGRLDAVVANYGSRDYYSAVVASTVSVLLGNGDGTLQPPQPFEAGSGPHGISMADFNRDGLLDLAVANLGGYPQRATTAAVLLGRGDGTFAAPQLYDAGHALTGIATGDFNADGNPDLALSSGDSAEVSVLLGNGNGTLRSKAAYGAGSSPKSVATGYLNGDQMLDLVVTDHWSDTVSVLLGNGDGTFQPRTTCDTGRNPAWVTIADLNRDGFADLAVADWFSTTVTVLEGNGNGSFDAGVGLGAAAAPEKVVVADFDGDAQPDLAVANYFAASVSILLNRTAASPPPPPPPPPPQRAATPTFNPAPGTYAANMSVALSTATSSAVIHYTTDGSAPTTASASYAGPIAVSRTTTIRAMAVAAGMTNSDVASGTYTLQPPPPAFDPPGGHYLTPQFVAISSAVPSAAIHYTTDGSEPTTASPRYTGQILVAMTTTIRAIAVVPGWSGSAVASATYRIGLQP